MRAFFLKHKKRFIFKSLLLMAQSFLCIKALSELNELWTETQGSSLIVSKLMSLSEWGKIRIKSPDESFPSQCFHLIVSFKASLPEFHSEWLEGECHCTQSAGEAWMILVHLGGPRPPEQTDIQKLGLIWNNIASPQTLSLLVSWLLVRMSQPQLLSTKILSIQLWGKTHIPRHTK